MNQKQLLQLLRDEGWVLRRAKRGSNMHFTKEGYEGRLTIVDREPTAVIPKPWMAGIRRHLGKKLEGLK